MPPIYGSVYMFIDVQPIKGTIIITTSETGYQALAWTHHDHALSPSQEKSLYSHNRLQGSVFLLLQEGESLK